MRRRRKSGLRGALPQTLQPSVPPSNRTFLLQPDTNSRRNGLLACLLEPSQCTRRNRERGSGQPAPPSLQRSQHENLPTPHLLPLLLLPMRFATTTVEQFRYACVLALDV